MIFVDASAIVAIMTSEPEGPELEVCILGEENAATSSIAVYEATVAIDRKLGSGLEQAEKFVQRFLVALAVKIVAVEAEDAALALHAFARYGEARGHPAQLNMGDCFAYAMAVRLRAALLYRGEDFARTDIRSALSPR